MQKLIEGLTKTIDLEKCVEDYDENNDPFGFLKLSTDWADYCLKHHVGTALRLGIAISVALAEYNCELEEPGHMKDQQ